MVKRFWCFATQKFCYYVIDRSRASPVVKKVFGTIFKGILICDFRGAYNKISALAKQRRFYHLFTEPVKVDKRNSSDGWKAFRKKLSRLLKDAIRLSLRKDQLDSSDYDRLRKRLHDRLDQILQVHCEDKDAKRLIKRLKRHRNGLFTFLHYEEPEKYLNRIAYSTEQKPKQS
ncbi:MAG: transposase [Deltaproteobacteria bacterium]|nr:transposase [Deltaproteobacteria bacterium]